MGNELQRWADVAQFDAAPTPHTEGGTIEPQVHLLWMTPDPLGAIAAACRMYEGIPTYALSHISDDERRKYWEDVQKTHLQAPLEFVKLHFFIEGVDRAFTHQMVRQRTAVFAQESLRFAVKNNLSNEAIPPITIQENDSAMDLFRMALEDIGIAYMNLVDSGIPAEDARALLPHCVSTRLNYCTDLRALSEHAGNRLCTQAQFPWRKVFSGIVQAIRYFNPGYPDYTMEGPSMADICWQFDTIASSSLFRPVCYQVGHCPFKASFDRGCTIRERVDGNAKIGRSGTEWHTSALRNEGTKEEIWVGAINPAEWLLNPEAGRTRTEEDRP